MFGVGGGFIMVPLLMWLAGMDQRRAAATSLLAVVPIAAVSAIGYGIQGEIDLFAALIVGGGALVGAPIGTWLLWMFIVGMLVVALRLVLVAPERGAEVEFSTGVLFGYLLLGLVMGTASGMF